jgi:hypothetical protein
MGTHPKSTIEFYTHEKKLDETIDIVGNLRLELELSLWMVWHSN